MSSTSVLYLNEEVDRNNWLAGDEELFTNKLAAEEVVPIVGK
jgi:hypothetical protein